MDNQEYQSHFTGENQEPPEPEEFEPTGRYDNEPMLQKWLRKAWQLRQECIAQQHKLGKLEYNSSTNVMTCGNCGFEMDLNDLVSPELKVRRYVA